jgi:hypothetical protein
MKHLGSYNISFTALGKSNVHIVFNEQDHKVPYNLFYKRICLAELSSKKKLVEKNRLKAFKVETDILRRLVHPNLLNLIFFTDDRHYVCRAFEYPALGDLNTFLEVLFEFNKFNLCSDVFIAKTFTADYVAQIYLILKFFDSNGLRLKELS